MDVLRNDDGDYGKQLGTSDPRDTIIQIVLSAVLGLGAFIAFCILRPRWPSLFAARKKQRNEASPLPELPDSLFGWIPALWKINEQQVLASAGLDAYVFLRLFPFALKFLAVTLFFAVAVIKPVHDAFPDDDKSLKGNNTDNSTLLLQARADAPVDLSRFLASKHKSIYDQVQTDYLWMYLVFVYIFSSLAIYLMISETERIISIRQQYLGSRVSVTDRTIRLSGIPPSLRTESKIKEFIEGLELGKVENVSICMNWKELDDLMERRMSVLRKLEEAWTVYTGSRHIERNLESLPISQPPPPGPEIEHEYINDEEAGLLPYANQNGSAVRSPFAKRRPKVTVRYGFFKLRSKYVDAIDYYEEHLRRLDEQIKEKRKDKFEPTPLAFVTMDSVAACQMAVQAVLDPSPMTLIAKLSPAPTDVVWRNTYMSRSRRMLRSWSVTIVITLLTIFWSILLVPIAGILNLESIHKVWPQLAEALNTHPFARSLVKTQLPTLLSTLLFVAVPYLYDWLANIQGMTSQGDVELSVISKNFFFVFFNYFVVFTVLGTASNFYNFWENFQDSLKDTTRVAFTLARSLQGLLSFYTNLIILQGIGLFPFRLLEFGSMILYPIYRIGAKTPRDYAELVQPPIFYYGFYLPQVMLIFVICIVYSVLRESWKVLLSGLIYFAIGGFVYKYQLLYAMDHRQHSTGRAWVMICNRMTIGLVLFQLTTAGQLALKGAFKRSIAVIPLILATIWFSYMYSQSYTPLMKFISLRTIVREVKDDDDDDIDTDPDGWGEEARIRESRDRSSRLGPSVSQSSFTNPSLVAPLQDVWIADEAGREAERRDGSPRQRLEGALNAVF